MVWLARRRVFWWGLEVELVLVVGSRRKEEEMENGG